KIIKQPFLAVNQLSTPTITGGLYYQYIFSTFGYSQNYYHKLIYDNNFITLISPRSIHSLNPPKSVCFAFSPFFTSL
ncbi:hypothetical protein NE619_17650, partial [Anaerovorax odorimutans]